MSEYTLLIVVSSRIILVVHYILYYNHISSIFGRFLGVYRYYIPIYSMTIEKNV